MLLRHLILVIFCWGGVALSSAVLAQKGEADAEGELNGLRDAADRLLKEVVAVLSADVDEVGDVPTEAEHGVSGGLGARLEVRVVVLLTRVGVEEANAEAHEGVEVGELAAEEAELAVDGRPEDVDVVVHLDELTDISALERDVAVLQEAFKLCGLLTRVGKRALHHQ